MAKFDLMGMLSERSIQETEIPEQKIVYRSPKDLVPDKENFYNIKKYRRIKESIRLLGILQPLLIENREGKDYIVAGHCRRKCCMELLEEGEERFQKIPCIYVVKDNLDIEEDDEIAEIIREFRRIKSNDYREKNDWEKMEEALRSEELAKRLRKKVKLQGKTREIASDLSGVSSGQIGRYRNIKSNLSEDLMAEFREDRINISTAAELAGLKPEYQQQAYEILLRDGMISINDAKLLKARQEQENLPGQMTIEQALHPEKPEEADSIIPVDIQIEHFFRTLQRNIATHILENDLNMSICTLSESYGTVRVRIGYLNYQGKREGILFNPGSDQEELLSWKDFSEKLIEKYGKKQKPIKTVSIDTPEELHSTPEKQKENYRTAECITGKAGSGRCGAAACCDKPYKCCSQCPEDCNIRCGWVEERKENFQPAAENAAEKQQSTLTETEAVKALFEAYPDKLKVIMRICRKYKNNGEAAKEVQKKIAPHGWNSTIGWSLTTRSEVEYTFMGFAAGLEITVKKEKVKMKYGRLIVEAKNLYNPYSPEFDTEETHFVENNKIEDHSGEDTEMVSDPEIQIPEAWSEYLRDLPIPTDTEITDYLYRQEKDLKQMLEIEKENSIPHMTVMKQQMLVAGLRLLKNLLHDCEEPEQSPLPEMRNNDQRKEWLRNYKSWGLWYEDKHTGIKYYKYDFANGARLIAEEFQPDPEVKTQWYTPGESYYLHLVGGPKPEHQNDKKWTYHSRYDKYPNSETELVEFLKEIQK